MGHHPAGTGSGRLLIKPPKQDQASVATTNDGQIPRSALNEAKQSSSNTSCGDETDPVSQPPGWLLPMVSTVRSWSCCA